MSKEEFLAALDQRLASLPKSERDKSLEYYSEMIVERMEDGMSEQEAVAALGGMEDIVSSVMSGMSFQTLIQARVNDSKQKTSSKGLWVALMICSAPLVVALAAALLAVYIALWAVIVALYAVLIAFAAACAGSLIAGGVILVTKSLPLGLCAIGVSLICGAMTLLAARYVPLMTRRLIELTASMLRALKAPLIVRKGEQA